METLDNLVPEEILMSSLAPLWRKRLEKAVTFLYESLASVPSPSLEEISEHCAVSPYHLHRMFHLVFHETPGQYLRRLRLQTAFELLTEWPTLSVTDIAHKCGFSSSQALAKSLRREVGVTAKEIRGGIWHEDPEYLENLILKLGHPIKGEAGCLEQEAAKNIRFRLEERPSTALQVSEIAYPWTDSVEKFNEMTGSKKDQPLWIVTQVSQLNESYSDQVARAGFISEHEEQTNYVTVSGCYLVCDLKLGSEAAYVASWDRMYDYILETGLDIDENDDALEIIHNPDALFHDLEAARMTLMVPVSG
ncbi:helix-turn-helix transcriptional regulator [Endozoicomonas arenosclerae]|uniref:helix-turn-helix transcriptional regulator n=1 Tax=Endozoicomonas arenosclerae TaxID=1633495 RepID=UPI000784D54B|nr:helix-turn-helix transcriptional regulator [Endozoicomonas arenosclerae]